MYLALPSVAMSSARVEERVAHGGHNIPEKDINRRFPRSLRNLLQDYGVLVDRARCFMNISDVPELIFEQYGGKRTIIHESYYQVLLEEAVK